MHFVIRVSKLNVRGANFDKRHRAFGFLLRMTTLDEYSDN